MKTAIEIFSFTKKKIFLDQKSLFFATVGLGTTTGEAGLLDDWSVIPLLLQWDGVGMLGLLAKVLEFSAQEILIEDSIFDLRVQ